MSRISSNPILNKSISSKSKTLIILDWDDTLFPTSWAIKNNIDLTDIEIQNKYIVFFAKLDLLLYKFLNNLTKYGKVVIVTNAMSKWIIIATNILPNTQMLIKNKIKIISARDRHHHKHPGNGFIWKKLIFEQLVSEYYDYCNKNKHCVQNIISVGDAEYEFQALINLDKNDKRYLKSIRFMNNPSYDTLIDQLEVLNNSIPSVVNKKTHMDLMFNLQ